MPDQSKTDRINQIVDTRLNNGNFRHEIAKFVNEGATNILEYGYGDGSLLLGLRRDKGCSGIYGVEVNPTAITNMDGLLDKTWLIDLNQEDAWLEPEYEGFFNYILAPMSLEHTYDPWYVMKKFNKYLAPGGKLIAQTPNAQSWETLYRLLTGDFPYVSGGTWDYTHIRWYTLKSFIDTAFVAGFKVTDYLLQLTPGADLPQVQQRDEIKTLRLPPPELNISQPPIDIVMPVDIKPIYPLFLAHAMVVVMEKDRNPEDYDPTPAMGYLEKYRFISPNPLGEIASLIDHPIMSSIIEKVKVEATDLSEDITAKLQKGKR